MNKLRSDSAFCQLTPQQADTLETWLFEERLSYPKVVEKLKAEFGLETSLTGVRRFYKRLDVERSAQSLMDAAEMSGLTIEALKSGELKPAMLLFANKCLFELLRQSPVPIKEVATLLRAITSAEAHTMRQTIYEREQAELREAARVRKVEEGWRMTPWDLEQEKEERRQERAARKKARLEAAEKAAKGNETCAGTTKSVECSPSPQPSPPGEGEESAQQVVRGSDARGSASGNLVSKNGKGEERAADQADGSATKDVGGAWQPSVVEEREDAEGYVAEAAENRLTPLNAA
jgi:hypothetical protein